ncbi:killer cell lectin-like receptor 2 [Sturnira hondurensis]|uniref:killer cell lectin-like receptor 2 n=1 Tax=Sturnira hondurensis TaxID=192404 RepID=UPI0018797333|nr:killer cell lectin-like receptor 2 [Sturnira hondurensis]
MSHQEVIYVTPTDLQFTSASPKRVGPGGTRRPGKSDGKECAVPWHLIAVTLGILCLLLLITVIVLGTMIFQCIQEKHQQDELLQNLRLKFHIMQNDNFTFDKVKQLLTNKTLASDFRKNKALQEIEKLVSLLSEKNSCYRKDMTFSKSLQNTGKLHEEHWSCCGENCYLFTNEDKNWNGCKQACQSYGLSLLKIDDKDELDFLQQQTYNNNYWIGLSYNEKKSKWEWVGSDAPGINHAIMSLTSGRRQCAFLSSTRIESTECYKTYNCMCEQSIFSAFKTLRRKGQSN